MIALYGVNKCIKTIKWLKSKQKHYIINGYCT